jgi:transcriptional regulator with XRE-family HTH domain
MIVNNIAAWRSKANDGKGVSQAHLARRVGVSRSYVTKLEKGDAQPSGDLMLRIAAYFKQPVESFFQLIDGSRSKDLITWSPVLPTSQFSHDLKLILPVQQDGDPKGQIVGKSNGEGRGVPVAQ